MQLKHWLSMLFCGTALLTQAAPGTQNRFSDFKFRLLTEIKGHGEYTFSHSPSAFDFKIRNVDTGNYGVIVADFSYHGTAQQVLAFQLEGAPGNGNANLTVSLCYEVNGKWYSKSVSGIRANYSDPKRIVLALNRDFQFGDAPYHFVQLKFGFGGGAHGTTSVLKISDVRLVPPEDLNVSGNVDPLVVPFAAAAPEKKTGIPVFFDFDNDDNADHAMSRKTDAVKDNVSPNSFARQLLLGSEGLLRRAATPAEAKVIVSSRQVPGPDAKAIASAAAKGTKLLLFGKPADPELEALAPMSLTLKKLQGLPPQEKLAGKTKRNSFVRYYDAVLRPGANASVRFTDGTPFAAEKGNVRQYASGIANQMDGVSEVFYDRGLLKELCTLGGGDPSAIDAGEAGLKRKQLAAEEKLVTSVLQEAGLPVSAKTGWQIGASRENFGRFGWQIGTGLLYSMLGRDLSLSCGSGAFRLFAGANRQFPLLQWSRKAIKGNVRFSKPDTFAPWEGEGTAEYVTTFRTDPQWQGKPLSFVVRGGIDDTDVVTLNGKVIGATDEKTPFYWECDRNYPIPAGLLKKEGENRLVVQMTNLRGTAEFHSVPLLTLGREEEIPRLAARTDWTNKIYRMTRGGKTMEQEVSLLTPMVRFSFPQDNELTFTQENIAGSALFFTAAGPRITSFQKDGVLYDAAKDGKWTKPCLLLFRKGVEMPFLLVFQHNPKRITAKLRGGRLESLALAWDKAAGEIVAGWPFGLRKMDGSGWENGLPQAMQEKFDLAARRALTWPVQCDEIFSIDRKNGKVQILDRFRFRKIADDWKTPEARFVTLPPLVQWMRAAGKLTSTAEKLADTDRLSNLGTVPGKDGSTIAYAIDLPSGEDFLPIGIPDGELYEAGNAQFATSSRYMGGGTPNARLTPAHPYGQEALLHSICPFRWSFGLGAALHGALMLNDANRAILAERARVRHTEVLDLYEYKFMARHRKEPFSGVEYPMPINAFFPNPVNFAPGFGSIVNHGDANEAALLLGWIGEQLADRFGQKELVKTHWPYYRYTAKLETSCDDYGFMSGSCRETGIGAWIDMLNAEYSGMVSFSRIAELAGDRKLADQYLYRAARRSVPTLARLFAVPDLEKIQPDVKGRSFQMVGFSSSGPSLMFFPNSNGNFHCANDLFDFSEGFTGGLIALYHKYALPQVQEHLEKRAWPTLMGGQPKMASYEYTGAFGAFSADPEAAMEFAREAVRQNPLWHDWPGIMRAVDVGCVLWNNHGKVALSFARGVTFGKVQMVPNSKVMTMELTAGDGAELYFRSGMPVKQAFCGSRKVSLRKGAYGYRLPLGKGKQTVRVEFR